MIKLSVSSFLTTLKEIIFTSTSSVLFIIIGILFTTFMIIDLKKNKKINKKLFLIGWIFITIYILIRYITSLTYLFDNLVNTIFMQIFFPSLSTYIIIIIITNIIYLVNINKNKILVEKIIDTIFYAIITFSMIYLVEEIIKEKINVYSEEIFTNEKVLVLVETTTILFTIWMIYKLGKYILTKLLEINSKKIEEKYKDEKQPIDQNLLDELEILKSKAELLKKLEKQTQELTPNPEFLNVKEEPSNNKNEENVTYVEDEYEDIEILEI